MLIVGSICWSLMFRWHPSRCCFIFRGLWLLLSRRIVLFVSVQGQKPLVFEKLKRFSFVSLRLSFFWDSSSDIVNSWLNRLMAARIHGRAGIVWLLLANYLSLYQANLRRADIYLSCEAFSWKLFIAFAHIASVHFLVLSGYAEYQSWFLHCIFIIYLYMYSFLKLNPVI